VAADGVDEILQVAAAPDDEDGRTGLERTRLGGVAVRPRVDRDKDLDGVRRFAGVVRLLVRLDERVGKRHGRGRSERAEVDVASASSTATALASAQMEGTAVDEGIFVLTFWFDCS
jgi:hypothetical protein